MADSKISDLTALTTTASGDSLPIVDASASATKKITVQNLFKEIPVSVGINFDSPALKLHVVNDLASSPLYASNQCAVFEDDNRPGIQMAGSANNIGLIDFGDNAAFNSGGIHYKHASDSFVLLLLVMNK